MAKTPPSEDAPRGPRGRPGSPRARLFLALDLPAEQRARIAAWRDEAIAGRDELRPVREEYLHATLVFLGYRPEKAIEEIARVAFEAAGALRAPSLAPAGIEAVPRRRPRLFALALEDEGGRAAALQTAAEAALADAGHHRPEKRPWWPHVTLARVKARARAEPLEAPPPPAGSFAAPDVVLYRSLLRPEGARYEALERVRLAAAG